VADLRQGTGGHPGGERRRSVLMLPTPEPYRIIGDAFKKLEYFSECSYQEKCCEIGLDDRLPKTIAFEKRRAQS